MMPTNASLREHVQAIVERLMTDSRSLPGEMFSVWQAKESRWRNNVHVTVDALCALMERPAPSREGLERIFRRHEEPLQQLTGITQKVTLSLNGELINDLLAWAQGGEASTRWCDHMTRDRDRWICADTGDGTTVTDLWTCCPICQTKRPT